MNSQFTPNGEITELLEKFSDAKDWFNEVGLIKNSEKILVKDENKALKELISFRTLLKKSLNTYLEESKVSSELINRTNEILKENEVYLQVSQGEEKVSFEFTPQKSLNNILLVLIAIECAKLISSDEFKYIKKCHNHTCSLFFLDTSKNHKRKWCSMETCGNRSKVKNFAKRQSSKEE